MKHVRLTNDVTMYGVKNFKGEDKLIDFYVCVKGSEFYAFTRSYTTGAYDICKSSVRVNDLIGKKNRDKGVMKLVNYTKLMIPYLVEYYDLPICS